MERGLGNPVMQNLLPIPPRPLLWLQTQSLGSDTLGPSLGRTALTFSELHNPHVLICEITYLPHT